MRRRELKISWKIGEKIDDVDGYSATKAVRGPADLIPYLAPLAGEVQEVLVIVAVDARMRVIGHAEVTRGNAYSTTMPKAETLRAAIMSGGVAFFVAHNHPSGDTTPSEEDKAASRELYKAAPLVGLSMLDSLIVGVDEHGKLRLTSLRETGDMF